MDDVANYIEHPKKDTLVKEVFTEDMFQSLKTHMQKMEWHGVDQVEQVWRDNLSGRKIIDEFMKVCVYSCSPRLCLPRVCTCVYMSTSLEVTKFRNYNIPTLELYI